MYLHAPERLVLPYTRAMMSFLLFVPDPKRILMIGLGGGSMAKFLLHTLPHCQFDVVERSRPVTQLAHAYFGLPRSTRLRIHIGDGADFVCQRAADAVYDAILVDAFTAQGIPASIVSAPFFAHCAATLAPAGVVACNLWGGRQTGFRTTLATLRRHFGSNVFTLQVRARGNVIALATASRAALGPPMEDRAVALQRRTGLRFIDFAAALRRAGGFWHRLLA
ncbi:MAG: fused MFS/spermidine synthase [Gammaproteobacteria bacterium]